MNLRRCNICGRIILAGAICASAAFHSPDHMHGHSRSPGEGFATFGKVAVSSATTQLAVTIPAIATSLGTVTVRWTLPCPPS